jgi:hypothetical protein
MTPIERARRLSELSKLNSESEMEEFDRHIEALIGHTDAATLAELFHAFDDETSDPGVMWRLLQLVESVDDDTYVIALARAAPAMGERAHGWAVKLLGRVINSEKARAAYVRAIPAMSPAERVAASSLLADVAKAHPKLVDRVEPISKQLASG